MGTNESTSSRIGETLFTKTQRQVLGLLFGNPEKSYYAKEIVRHAGVGIGAVQRELEKLSAVGLLTVTRIGNQKHYQANETSPIFTELRGIVRKSFGLADVLAEALSEVSDRISVAFIYGSIAKGSDKADSDIDIMLVSDNLGYADVMELFTETEALLGRAISPAIYTMKELRQKIATDNSFVTRVLNQDKVFLVGGDNDIPKP